MKLEPIILQKYLEGNANEQETRQVRAWFATSEGQEHLADFLENDFESLCQQDVYRWVNHSIPTERMRSRLLAEMKRPKKRYRVWWAAAVIVPLIFLLGLTWLLSVRVGLLEDEQYAEFVVPPGEQMRVVLQDGSVVHLNSGSRLSYPKRFGFFERKVSLQGEAYFDVESRISHPFVVQLDGMEVRVKGTSFNVKAYPSEDIVQVMLSNGCVELKDKQKRIYRLLPGDYAEYNRRSGICSIEKTMFEESVTGWRTHCLNFHLTPLKDILKTLERQYDVAFEVEDSVLLATQFTLSTSKVQVTDILEELEQVSRIEFRYIDVDRRIIVSTKQN